MKTQYAADKPSDCRYCYYWKNKRTGCSLGKANCYYRISPPPKLKSDCDGCPYIRLTNLIPELLDMVDEKKIAFNPAVEISYLKPEEQQDFLEAMDYAQSTPSLSQAQRLKKFSQEGKCSLDAMCAIMSEEKKGELDRVTIKHDVLRKYFPKSYTPKQMEDTIIKLLEQWQRKREKSMER